MNKFIIHIVFLFSSLVVYAQYQYTVEVTPNAVPKQHLNAIAQSIDHTSKRIDQGIFIIQSDKNYTEDDFTIIIEDLGLHLSSFQKTDKVISPSATPAYTKKCCEIQLIMQDSYEDGWNGGYLTVTIDGTSQDYSASGSGTLEYLSYCDTNAITIEYTAGSYESENTYEFEFPDGSTFSDGPSPATGTVFSGSFMCGNATSQDCEGAEMVCSNESFQGNSSGSGNYYDLKSSNDGCLGGENQSSWYYIYIDTGGTLSMEIAPDNGTDDYDFAIWGPYDETTAQNNCPPVEDPVRCNWVLFPKSGSCGTNTNPTGLALDASLPTSNDDCTNNPYVRHLDTQDDEVYILVIDNYSSSSEPFDLTWGGTAMMGCKSIVLPVELISFEAKNYNSSNRIHWSTASENNNDYFTLEYSSDADHWEELAQIDGAGTSSSTRTYSFEHRDFTPGVNYYRLMQFDYDGTKKTFNAISIDNKNQSTIVKRVNTMGQVVDKNFKGLVILYYDDGSIVKTVQ